MRKRNLLWILILALTWLGCKKNGNEDPSDVQGYALLTALKGHWIGSNETVYGPYAWFAFDFRPISPSHLHSIYEGGTNQNIITSLFIADFDGQHRIMARNGGWLGPQYRATYFVLDSAFESGNMQYYRLVDAIGRERRAYMEFRFERDSLFFDAYKDDSGSLDLPVHHMGFKGINVNPSLAQEATELFAYPQDVSEVNLEGAFTSLIDTNSALFLEESDDPFPKSDHGHLSDLKIDFERSNDAEDLILMLYLSTEPLVDAQGSVDYSALDTKVIRTISIQSNEDEYTATYVHPDTYYVTIFADFDGNEYPSSGDLCNISRMVQVTPETLVTTATQINLYIP
ncbi:hypothetical protein HZ996_11865 [Cryomorphaceae bacterium]|nr:hypothetical protein HZ996_11865 [Cryomorphaceae bacterium]